MFWVAPATLVFDNVSDLRIVHPSGPAHALSELEVADLHRADGHWHLEGHTFDVRLRADGFRQVVRAVPRRGREQRLSLSERGGYCFDESPADL